MSKDKPKDSQKASPSKKKQAGPKQYGPRQFGNKPWQSGKPHLTAAQRAGKMRKVH